jgi:hypothetical protein
MVPVDEVMVQHSGIELDRKKSVVRPEEGMKQRLAHVEPRTEESKTCELEVKGNC